MALRPCSACNSRSPTHLLATHTFAPYPSLSALYARPRFQQMKIQKAKNRSRVYNFLCSIGCLQLPAFPWPHPQQHQQLPTCPRCGVKKNMIPSSTTSASSVFTNPSSLSSSEGIPRYSIPAFAKLLIKLKKIFFNEILMIKLPCQQGWRDF